MDIDKKLHKAVQSYWDARARNKEKQIVGGKIDAGTRGEVTGGSQMGAMEVLVADILCDAGLKKLDIKTRTSLELPGYYRPEKKWDLIVVSEGQLVTAMEFKSQVGHRSGTISTTDPRRLSEALPTSGSLTARGLRKNSYSFSRVFFPFGRLCQGQNAGAQQGALFQGGPGFRQSLLQQAV